MARKAHTDRAYEAELRDLRDKLLQMAGEVEDMISKATAALVDCDVNGSIESAIGTAANVHFALAEPCVTMPCVISVNAPSGRHPNRAGGNYYGDDICTEPLPWRDGMLLPPEAPGLGIGIGNHDIHASHGIGPRSLRRRLEAGPVDFKGLVQRIGCEMRGEGVGQAE